MKTDTRLIQPSALQILPTAAQAVRRSAESAKPFEELLDDQLKPGSEPASPSERPEASEDAGGDQGSKSAETDPRPEPSAGEQPQAATDKQESVAGHQQGTASAQDDAGTLFFEETPAANDSRPQAVDLQPASASVAITESQATPNGPIEQPNAGGAIETPRPEPITDDQPKPVVPAKTDTLLGLSRRGEQAREQIQSDPQNQPATVIKGAGDRVVGDQPALADQPAKGVEHPPVADTETAFRQQIRQQVLSPQADDADAAQSRVDAPARPDQGKANPAPALREPEPPTQPVQNTTPANAASPAAIVAAPVVPDAIRSVLERIQGVRSMLPGAASVQGSGAPQNPGSVTAIGSAGGATIGGDASSAPKLAVIRGQASTVDRGAVIAQVQRGLASLLRSGGGDMTIRLRPDHLGDLKIRVHAEDGSIRASFETKTEGAREAIEHGLIRLREQLESKGIRVEELRVDYRDQGADDAGGESSAEGSRDPREQGEDTPTQNPGGVDEATRGTDTPHDQPRGIWTELGLDAVA